MKNITDTQREFLERLYAQDKTAKVRWDDGRGIASVLSGKLMDISAQDAADRGEEVLRDFLDRFGPLVAPDDAREVIKLTKVHRAKDGTVRLRAMQSAKDIPIFGATLLLFFKPEVGLQRVQSGCFREVEVPPLEQGGRPVDVDAQAKDLHARLTRRLRADDEGGKFHDRKLQEGFGGDETLEKNFPLTAPPRHWLYLDKEGFRHVFRLHAWQPFEWLGVNGEMRKAIDLVDLVVDIATGRIIHEGGRLGAWSDVLADGLSTLQESGGYITRPLLAVQEDAAERLLANRTHSTDVFTHDANGTETGLVTKLQSGTDLSEDADGHWNATTTSCTAADRRDAQQPETDAHFFGEQAFAFYDALGWEGFDNGEWGSAPCDVRIAAHIGMGANAYFWRWIDGSGRHFGYMAFYDGQCSGGTVTMDFMAGDPGIFAHEYQHAVTYFGSVDGSGDPGYLETGGWHRAIHEGISDSMAGLRTGTWTAPGLWPDGACRNNLPFRRIEYPRSTATSSGGSYCDHYDDRVGSTSPYTNSTILSHAIFLAGQGGVHERTSRPAELIPVPGAGRDAIAAIVHDAVTNRFDSIPSNSTGVETMIEAANFILDAAKDAAGVRSCEYVMLRRAFHAVGLHPFDASFTPDTYGGEACMLPWTTSWRLSRPYLGFPAHWWRSPDLFINNGSGVEYDASVGLENNLFARVRNIGDQDLTNVVVRFYFRAHGTALPPSSTAWKPCQDSGGTDCVLTIATLAAESMNFTNPASPPASQAVRWHLPASEIVAGIDHFCVRAEIEVAGADNHDNDCPYRVQSNVSYTPLSLAGELDFTFHVANWEREPIPLELDIDDRSLPEGAKVHFAGPGDTVEDMQLKPGEEIALYWKLEVPFQDEDWYRPPFDGPVTGKLFGADMERTTFEAELSGVRVLRQTSDPRSQVSLSGHMAGHARRHGERAPEKLGGAFKGDLDTRDGSLRGVWTTIRYRGRNKPILMEVKVEARLRPTRAIHFAQRIRGELVGGVTFALRWDDKPPRG